MTSEQLEAARAERMRQNGHGALTLEDARTWMEETGLCLFLPKRQFSTSLAPSFVEAVAGQRNATPDQRQIATAEELLVRLETEGVAVRLNLLGQPGEQPDYVVAAWVLPYVYALRGDRDWRRTPQLTGSRQVSPLAIQAYKRLETGDSTIAELKTALGQGVSEMAVLRAITELWQQLRIIPVISAPGTAAKWQLLRTRFQKAIAEGASTSQVTAISVLASIFLQAVIAASMEEVEIFLSPLTARSKIREVLRGLVATRQVHTLSLGHAPHFYVAGTLPEFTPAPTIYSSSLGSSYLSHLQDQEDSLPEAEPMPRVEEEPVAAAEPEPVAHSNGAHRKATKPAPQRHFSRSASHQNRKPASSSNNARPTRRSADARPSSSRNGSAARPASAHGHSSNGRTANGHASNGHSSNGHTGNGHASASKTARPASSNGHAAHSTNGARKAKPAAPARGKWAGNRNASASKTAAPARKVAPAAPRKENRTEARSNRKPALAASGSKRFSYSGSKAGTKKRG